MPKAVFQIMNK